VKAINLVSWSGDMFSFTPDMLIDLPDEIGKARIEAGLMREATEAELKDFLVYTYPREPAQAASEPHQAASAGPAIETPADPASPASEAGEPVPGTGEADAKVARKRA